MRKVGAALAVALLSTRIAAWGASAEPELVPMESAPRRPKGASLPPARPLRETAAPAPRPTAPHDPSFDSIRHDAEREALRRVKPVRPFIVTRARAWFAQGSVDTRYSIQIPSTQVTPPGTEVFYGETREMEAHGLLMLYSAELAPLDWLSLEAEYGQDKPKGTFTDRFWIHSPNSPTLTNFANGATWQNPDHEDDTVKQSDHSARRDWTSASLHFRVLDGKHMASEEWEFSHALDLTVGAHRFRQDGRITNERVTQSNGKFFTAQPLGPLPGMNGTYSAQWRGPHFGFREEMVLPLGFNVDGALLWSPFMEFRGDGYDNKLAGLRGETPNYADRSHGSALHFRLGAGWSWRMLRVEAGFLRLAFSSHRGNRRYYLNSGAATDQPLEKTETIVEGLYVGGSLRY